MTWKDIRFFDPRGDVEKTHNWLPHWEQLGCAYFLTFRQADSLPEKLLSDWKRERDAWLEVNPRPWSPAMEQEYHERFTARLHRWLDECHGSCLLRETEFREKLREALEFFEGRACRQLAWVIMPNHVHTVTVLTGEKNLGRLLQSWKRHSAREIHRAQNKEGTFWQKDYFDRLIRDPAHLMNCVRYIRRNPEKAGLKENEFTLWESDLAKGIK